MIRWILLAVVFAYSVGLCGCADAALGPKQRAGIASSSLDDARCYQVGLDAGTLADGGKSVVAGLAAFDACKAGAK